MLAEERYRRILGLLNAQKTVMVSELCTLLGTSESTIRRDLATLARQGSLTKVHGGAATNQHTYMNAGLLHATRQTINEEEKARMCKYAASLIAPNDFVFIDGGSTVELITDYLADTNARFVTCSIGVVQRLAHMGKDVLLIGGQYSEISETFFGAETQHALLKFNFTKGFFGATGITRRAGCTSVQNGEAIIKQQAISRCREAYILADSSKFGIVCAVTFADFESVQIITTPRIHSRYHSCANITMVQESEQ